MSAMVSGVYIALAAVLVVCLALRVSLLRRRHRVGLGAGAAPELEVAMRCHGNAVENLPMALLLLLLAEFNGLGHWLLHLAGIVLLASRLLHSWGLTSSQGGTSFGRFYGTVLCWTTILALAAYNLAAFVLA